jgi:mannose-6-phosphate isomerase-like protein (cupin superfamily)
VPPRSIKGLPWHEPPGHHGGFSKYVVGLEDGARHIDFRLSRYPIRGRVDSHTHERAEHVYYFLEGIGLATYDHEEYVVEPGMVMHVPPGTEHSVASIGDTDLVFIVVTSPPDDIPR